jgi:hypothetical protein
MPLDERCLRAPHLYSIGLEVLGDHTNCVCAVYQRKQGPRRFGQKLDSEDGRERYMRGLPEGTSKTHLCVRKA